MSPDTNNTELLLNVHTVPSAGGHLLPRRRMPYDSSNAPNQRSEITQTDLLTNPHPCRHIVYPYNDEEKAVNAVYLFASSGLRKEESVVLIMADSHRETIGRRLATEGFDLMALQASGQLECISADSMLRTFILSDVLDARLVKDTLGSVIRRASASSPTLTVRIFGEMVSLLLARNEVSIAERLEELWNEIIASHSISLLCTYTLLKSGRSILPDSLAKLHSHNLASWSQESDAREARPQSIHSVRDERASR